MAVSQSPFLLWQATLPPDLLPSLTNAYAPSNHCGTADLHSVKELYYILSHRSIHHSSTKMAQSICPFKDMVSHNLTLQMRLQRDRMCDSNSNSVVRMHYRISSVQAKAIHKTAVNNKLENVAWMYAPMGKVVELEVPVRVSKHFGKSSFLGCFSLLRNGMPS